ncbi:MFS transporter [Acrocarpospora catenulata]|uniref:MFS transporter n=1 Tax=Acrocarpospora catenulata TaxID=2836182 RepID=UPI001BDA3BBC|nr:MFS transporter [Acrocarpospora catenulata]
MRRACGVAVLVVAAIAVDIATVLLVALLGVVGHELGWLVGVAVAVYFLGGSLAAAVLGRRLEALGPRRVASAAATGSAVALLAVALAGQWPPVLLLASGFSGAAFGLTLPSTNAVLDGVVAPRRLVVVLCVKQAAIPIGLMTSAYLGTAASGISWRVPFAVAAAGALAAVAGFRAALRRPVPHSHTAGAGPPAGPLRPGLATLGWLTLLASFLPGALTGYAFAALVAAGFAAQHAAHLLIAANLLGIASRIVSGLLAQTRPERTDLVMAGMILTGGGGALLLAVGQAATSALGILVAFTFGWGWSGLMFAGAIRRGLGRPARAGAVVQSGGMLGSAAGPLVMAAAGSVDEPRLGWLLVGGLAVAAGGVLCWSLRAR